MEPDTIDSDPFKDYYEEACARTSDINEHLPILAKLALNCYRVTEFGVRDGQSTRAFLYAATRKIGPSLRSYDVDIHPVVTHLFEEAKHEGANVQYIKGNTLLIDIEPTDLLFIDTAHLYEQLSTELERHHRNVSKYIAMHDTRNMAFGAWDTEPRGLMTAIIDFLIKYPEQWHIHYNSIENNGLMVLKRNLWSTP